MILLYNNIDMKEHIKKHNLDYINNCNHVWVKEFTLDPCNYIDRYCKYCYINKHDLWRYCPNL